MKNNNWFVILLIIIAAIIVLPIAFNTVFLIATNILRLILVIILAGAVAYTGVYFINDIKVNLKKEREELKLASDNNKANDSVLNDNNITPVTDNNNFQIRSHAPAKLVELSNSNDEARKVVEAYDNTYNKIDALAKGDCYSVSDFENEFKDKMLSITSGLETYGQMVNNNIHDEIFETRVRYAVQSLIGQFDKAALKVFSNDVSDFNSKMHNILSENNSGTDSSFAMADSDNSIINEGEPVEAETLEIKGSSEIK